MYYTYLEDSINLNPVWAFTSEYDYYGYIYTDLLSTGVSLDYTSYGYGYYDGPYFNFITFTGMYGYVGSVTVSGDTIDWTIEDSYYGYDYVRNYYSYYLL